MQLLFKNGRKLLKAVLTLLFLIQTEIARCQNILPTPDTSIIHEIVDESAVPNGGMEKFMMYTSKNLRLPPRENMDLNGFAKCYKNINFIVEKNGSLTYLNNSNCTDKEIQSVFEKLIEEAPRWKPAKLNGKVVRQRYHFGFGCILLQKQ